MASTHESILVELRERIQSIRAGTDGYGRTFGAVERVVFFPEELAFDPTVKTICLIRPGRESRVVTNLGCYVEARLEVFIVVATRFEKATENPHLSDPVRWQDSIDLVGDVLQKIHEDTTLGGTCIDVVDVDTDLERSLPQWSLSEIRMVIKYRYVRAGGR